MTLVESETSETVLQSCESTPETVDPASQITPETSPKTAEFTLPSAPIPIEELDQEDLLFTPPESPNLSKTTEILFITPEDMNDKITEKTEDPIDPLSIDQNKKVKCTLCSGYYSTIKSLREHHLRIHMKQTRHSCQFCEFKTNLKQELTSHVKSHHSNGLSKTSLKYKCEVCHKQFSNQKNFEKHQKFHSESEIVVNPMMNSMIDAVMKDQREKKEKLEEEILVVNPILNLMIDAVMKDQRQKKEKFVQEILIDLLQSVIPAKKDFEVLTMSEVDKSNVSEMSETTVDKSENCEEKSIESENSTEILLIEADQNNSVDTEKFESEFENSIEKSLEIENPERNPGDQSQESEPQDFVSFFETKDFNLEKSIQTLLGLPKSVKETQIELQDSGLEMEICYPNYNAVQTPLSKITEKLPKKKVSKLKKWKRKIMKKSSSQKMLPNKSFFCDKCQKQFFNAFFYKCHLKQHSKKKR